MSVYGIKEIMEEDNTTLLTEQTIYAGDKIGIAVFPSETRNFIQDPYIKVYNSSSYEKQLNL